MHGRKCTKADTPYVIIDSWNDFAHGTEVCASRQYGEKYADDTRLFVNTFNGDKQWHAKYLAEQCPRTIRPRTLYQVPVRITNAGTLPWRAREGLLAFARAGTATGDCTMTARPGSRSARISCPARP